MDRRISLGPMLGKPPLEKPLLEADEPPAKEAQKAAPAASPREGRKGSPRPGGKASPRRREPELPDLTDKIVKAGLWQEYQRYRQGYLNWRQGKHQGARGEVTENGLVAEKRRMEFLEPSDAEWHWRKTLSYWIVILTLEGGVIFLFTCAFACAPAMWGTLLDAVTSRTSYVGNIMFFISTYLITFEVQNLKIENDSLRFNPFLVRTHLRHCYDIGLHPWPYMAGLTYFTGAVFFAEQQTLSFFPVVMDDPFTKLWLQQFPCMFGGVLFTIASIFEVVEWFTGRGKAVLMGVIHNVVGSFLFFVGGALFMPLPPMGFDPEWWGNFCYAVGGYCFVVASIISLVLWRDGNFGLTYSAQLANLAPHMSDRFSAVGIAVLVVLCFLGPMAALVFFCEAQVNLHNAHDEADYATRTFYPFLIFAFIHMVLALRSAVVKLPTDQPWRALHEACHLMLVLASFVLFAQFCDCVYQVRYSP